MHGTVPDLIMHSETIIGKSEKKNNIKRQFLHSNTSMFKSERPSNPTFPKISQDSRFPEIQDFPRFKISQDFPRFPKISQDLKDF